MTHIHFNTDTIDNTTDNNTDNTTNNTTNNTTDNNTDANATQKTKINNTQKTKRYRRFDTSNQTSNNSSNHHLIRNINDDNELLNSEVDNILNMNNSSNPNPTTTFSLKDKIIQHCLEIIKKDDVRTELKNAMKPVVDSILKKIYPYIYISMVFVIISFLITLGSMDK